MVIVIFILEIAGGIYAYTKRDTIQKSLETQLKEGINQNYGQAGTAAEGMTKAIDAFQKQVLFLLTANNSYFYVKYFLRNQH